MPTLQRFLSAWRRRAWDRIEEHLQLTFVFTTANAHEWIVTLLSRMPIAKFRVVGSVTHSPVCVEFLVKFTYDDPALPCDIRRINVIRESEAFGPSEHGLWGVNPISLLRTELARS